MMECRLCDICNVPGKTGSDTMKVINQQTTRMGVYMYDYVSGVGDGGGENEGAYGVHSLIEATSPEHAARRCMPHFAWRTFDAGQQVMVPHFKKSRSLNSYLHQGVTWRRLRSIAVLPIASGGLSLFLDASAECEAVFAKAPPRLIDMRPEATYDYIFWLIPRVHVLAKVIDHDLNQRSLEGTAGQ